MVQREATFRGLSGLDIAANRRQLLLYLRSSKLSYPEPRPFWRTCRQDTW